MQPKVRETMFRLMILSFTGLTITDQPSMMAKTIFITKNAGFISSER
jgi:hypothetical protein